MGRRHMKWRALTATRLTVASEHYNKARISILDCFMSLKGEKA